MTMRMRPKLTDEDRSRCARLMTAFLCGDNPMLENTMREVDEAGAANAVVLGLLDHACFVMERTGPLLTAGPNGEGDAP